ncbi:MAG: TrmB family transcriptional regulator [Nitrososphaerales archaeon]
MQNDSLAISLEELGLSKYEARAYIALLSRGPLSASELAYYSNLPRTKVYATFTKLAKKRLAVIRKDKPVVCSAIAPEDAFGELVASQANRVEGMKSLVEKLQKIGEEGMKPQGAEERRYLVLSPESVLSMIAELFSTTKFMVACTLDAWGARIISQCKDSLEKAVAGNVEIKILVSKELTSNNSLSAIPDGAKVKIGESDTNMFIFDRSTVILVNSSDGKGLLFRSADMITNLCSKMFDNRWSEGTEFLQIRLAKRTM